MKFTTILCCGFGLVTLVGAGVAYTRAAYESAEYDVVLQDGPFEIRDYASLVLASTSMNGSQLDDSSAFSKLFRYISGDNQEGQEISMTTPVFSSQADDQQRMSFVVPKEVAETGAPAPTGAGVQIETMPAGRFAAYRFSGRRDQASYAEARLKLTNWISDRGLTPTGNPLIAGYDPPITPPFLRRNEVLIRLAD